MSLEQAARCERVRKSCIKNALPLGFALALIIALAWPAPGEVVSKPEVEGFRLVQTLNVVIIFIISGLTLKTDDIKTALSKEGIVGFGYGVVSTLLITACVGFAAAEIPFDKKEFAYGLAVFCVVPTTLSSGVTLVMNVSCARTKAWQKRDKRILLGVAVRSILNFVRIRSVLITACVGFADAEIPFVQEMLVVFVRACCLLRSADDLVVRDYVGHEY